MTDPPAPRRRGDRRRPEERGQRQLPPEPLADARDDLGRLERVPAQLEEIVVDADLIQAEDLAPDGRQGSLGRRRRAGLQPVTFGRRIGNPSYAGSALRSTLPLAVSGTAASGTTWAGTR